MQKDLLQEIEAMRRSLNSFVSENNLVAAEEVKLSQRLDSLIIQYRSTQPPNLLEREGFKNY